MTNRHSVPIVVRHAPDDTEARALGESLEKALRRELAALRALCTVSPQPRWLFTDIAADRPLHASQLFRAFAILTRCREIPSAVLADVWAKVGALAMGLRANEDAACFAALFVEEMQAQGEADVAQLRVVTSNGKDRTVIERALETSTHHVRAAQKLSHALARMLQDAFSPEGSAAVCGEDGAVRDSELDAEFEAMERQIDSAHGKASAARRAQAAAEKERDELRAQVATLKPLVKLGLLASKSGFLRSDALHLGVIEPWCAGPREHHGVRVCVGICEEYTACFRDTPATITARALVMDF